MHSLLVASFTAYWLRGVHALGRRLPLIFGEACMSRKLCYPKAVLSEGKQTRVPAATVSTSDPYTARHLQVLEGLEAVRKRPGMYVGSTDGRGLQHCLWEIFDNSVDEALAGFGSPAAGAPRGGRPP